MGFWDVGLWVNLGMRYGNRYGSPAFSSKSRLKVELLAGEAGVEDCHRGGSAEFFDWALLDALHIEQATTSSCCMLGAARGRRGRVRPQLERAWECEHLSSCFSLEQLRGWNSFRDKRLFALGDGRIILMLCVFVMNVKFVLLATSQLLLVASSTCLKSLFPQVTDSVMVVVASII